MRAWAGGLRVFEVGGREAPSADVSCLSLGAKPKRGGAAAWERNRACVAPGGAPVMRARHRQQCLVSMRTNTELESVSGSSACRLAASFATRRVCAADMCASRHLLS